MQVWRYGYSAAEESTCYPLDAELNLPADRYSLGVRKLCSQEVIRGSYDEAGQALVRSSGARVPKSQMEELILRSAEDFDAF